MRHDSDTCSLWCSYESASLDVLEETRLMASNDFKQAAIQFYDDKTLSLINLKFTYFFR